MSTLPRLSTDLVDLLDEQEPKPAFPNTRVAAVNLDEGQIRLGIWHAARRALIDDLLAQLEEDASDATEAEESTDTEDYRSILDTPILDPSGQIHSLVAPIQVAAARPTTNTPMGS